MAIRFEFTVSDEEGDTLFDLVSTRIADAIEHSNNLDEEAATRAWWKGHAEYLQELRKKMSNSRV